MQICKCKVNDKTSGGYLLRTLIPFCALRYVANAWSNLLPPICEFLLQRAFKSKYCRTEEAVFKVYRVFLNSWDDVRQASKLRTMAEEGQIDIWLDARKPGQYLDIMISTKLEPIFWKVLSEAHLSHKITIRDVQRLANLIAILLPNQSIRLIIDQEKPLKPKKWKFANSNETDVDLNAFAQRRMRDFVLNDVPSKFGIAF